MNNTYFNNNCNSLKDNKKKEDSRGNLGNGISGSSNFVVMPLEVRLPPFGPGDQSIIFKNGISNQPEEPNFESSVNKKPKWCGIIYRIKNNEEKKIGKVQIANYIGGSMKNFPYL